MTTTDFETAAEADHAHLHAGKRITIDELAAHLSAIELRLRQLARAAEVPDTPIELADTITAMRDQAARIRDLAGRTDTLARIVAGDVPLRRTLPAGDGWGAAALGADREDYGGPAVIPTQAQLFLLARDARIGREIGDQDERYTTYPEAMAGVPRSIQLSWESKEAQARRRRERNAAVEVEVLLIECTKCEAQPGEKCRTASGWAAERAHVPRQREAEARVDARLGYIGDNPVFVPNA